MSNTEPWNYGENVMKHFSDCLEERYRLLPYTYSNAAAIAFEGSTLMRPLVFDFFNDHQALQQKYEYMFGRSLLVSPVTEPNVKTWRTYLPKTQGGWYDLRSNRHFDGGQTVETEAVRIPVFVRGGSIVPMATEKRQYAANQANEPLSICIFPGADAAFSLYEDDGETMAYTEGQQSRILFVWNDAKKRLTIGQRVGSYPTMSANRTFILTMPDGKTVKVEYKGKKIVQNLNL